MSHFICGNRATIPKGEDMTRKNAYYVEVTVGRTYRLLIEAPNREQAYNIGEEWHAIDGASGQVLSVTGGQCDQIVTVI